MVSAKLRAQALPPKKKKKAPQAPETADEFLAAGVDEEEGGEKWRAGDIVKSSRFFTRALEHYERGLQRYPQNGDLAYNRARLQYEICQQPRLLQAFRTTANVGDRDLLQLALDHHEYAIQLKRDDSDLVFNVGQLCRDMGEREQEAQNDAGALDYFTKASQAFLLCGNLQAAAMARQSQDQIPDVPTGQDSVMDEDTGDEAGESIEDDQWATVVEPITPASLYDTAVAAIEVVTSMVPLWPDDVAGMPSRLAELHIRGEQLIARLQELAEASAGIEDWPQEHPAWERELLAANFRAAYQDSLCKQSKTSVTDYTAIVTSLFNKDEPSAQWLADTAEADVDLNTTLALLAQRTPPGQDLATLASIRWKHLTRALNSLTALSKLGNEVTRGINLSVSDVHARRAECELLRRRLGEPGNGELNRDSGSVLASNAEKFFRGARTLAERDGEDTIDFHAREVITNRLAGGQQGAQGSLQLPDLERSLVEMVDEELLSEADAQRLAI